MVEVRENGEIKEYKSKNSKMVKFRLVKIDTSMYEGVWKLRKHI